MIKILFQHLRAWRNLVTTIFVIFSILGLTEQSRATGPMFSLLHSFTGASNEGVTPAAPFIQGTDGGFYSTTQAGGLYGLGTVFKMSSTGAVTTLHSFNGADGAHPQSGLVQATGGNFYGTTSDGGANNQGTVFKVDSTGAVTVLHSFNGTDGAQPSGGLVLAGDGNLYGATQFGGFNLTSFFPGEGTAFKITTGGVFTVLHYFGATENAFFPGGLIQGIDGNFYGTTVQGGAQNAGTLFRMNSSGTVAVIHSFNSDTEGRIPIGSLFQGNDGDLYGGLLGDTTALGGANSSTSPLYKVDTSGNVTILYHFNHASEGNYLMGLIQASDGNLYGTLDDGGPYRGSYADGAFFNFGGAVFRISSGGIITILHSFNGADGNEPVAILFQGSDGDLYGTTARGGTLNQGTAFKIALAPTTTPVANAGSDQSVNEGATVTLDGTGSTGQNLTYNWQQIAGPTGSLTNPTSSTPSFTAPQLPGGFGSQVMTFQLTVTSGGQSATATVNVTIVNINHAPEAHVGADQIVDEGSPVTLDGRASFDPDSDPIAYQWVQTGGPVVSLTGANSTQPSFITPLISGGISGPLTLTFSLTVSDGALSSITHTTVTVDNVDHAPVADPGDPQTVHSGKVVTLDGSASNDPDGDPITYQWVQVTGPTVQLNNTATAAPSFTAPPVNGTTALTFRLVVTDSLLTSNPEDVVVTVKNGPPLCNLARALPDVLWPPNHTMVPVGITGVTDPDDSTVSITIASITQDETVNGLGDGDTSPDASTQDGNLLLRAERSGKGNGRVYKISFSANDGEGGICTGSVKVGVPLSLKPGMEEVDDGQLYVSTQQ